MSVRWFVAAVVALFLVYVVGRALGILLGIGPYPTEVALMAIVIATFAWIAVRR